MSWVSGSVRDRPAEDAGGHHHDAVPAVRVRVPSPAALGGVQGQARAWSLHELHGQSSDLQEQDDGPEQATSLHADSPLHVTQREAALLAANDESSQAFSPPQSIEHARPGGQAIVLPLQLSLRPHATRQSSPGGH